MIVDSFAIGYGGFYTKNYSIYQYIFGFVQLTCSLLLIIMLLKTKARTVEMPRAGILGELNVLNAEIDQKQLKQLQESTSQADPVIEVKIKPRTKDHPSDDFKLVV